MKDVKIQKATMYMAIRLLPNYEIEELKHKARHKDVVNVIYIWLFAYDYS